MEAQAWKLTIRPHAAGGYELKAARTAPEHYAMADQFLLRSLAAQFGGKVLYSESQWEEKLPSGRRP